MKTRHINKLCSKWYCLTAVYICGGFVLIEHQMPTKTTQLIPSSDGQGEREKSGGLT